MGGDELDDIVVGRGGVESGGEGIEGGLIDAAECLRQSQRKPSMQRREAEQDREE